MLESNARAELGPRPCLKCGKVFVTDRWHRICKRCHDRLIREGTGRLVKPLKISMHKAAKTQPIVTSFDGAASTPHHE